MPSTKVPPSFVRSAVPSALAFAAFTALGITCWYGAYVFWPYGLYFSKGTAFVFWTFGLMAIAAPFVVRFARERCGLGLVPPTVLLLALYGAKSAAVTIPAITPPGTGDTGAFHRETEAGRLDFVLAGDIHTPNAHTQRLIEQATGLHDEFPLSGFFMLGDNMPEEPFEETVGWAFHAPFAPLLERGVPFYFVLGNHDYSGDLVEDQINYPDFNMKGRRWYSKTFGDGLVTFFILDTEAIIESPRQLQWLRERLRNDDSRWRVILTHKPLIFRDGQRGIRAPLSRLLADVISEHGGVDLFISGHLHHYERFVYRNGIKHLVISGTTHLNQNPRNPNDEYIVRNTEERAKGHLVVTPEEISFRAFGEQGQTLDEFTLDTPARGSRRREAAMAR